MDGAAILKRFREAESLKTGWDAKIQRVVEYAIPERQTYNAPNDGQPRDIMARIYDSTGIVAVDGFVSNMVSALVPPNKRWCRLATGVGIAPENRDQLLKQLEGITDTMFACLQISNFDTQIASSFYDLAVGMGALHVGKGTKENPFQFTAIPASDIYPEEGPFGRIDTVFRKINMPIRNILGTWDDANLPQSLKDALADDNGGKKVDLVESCVKMEDGYEYSVVLIGDDSPLLVQRQMRSSPFIVFRWMTLPGMTMSYGPLMRAFPDIRTLNDVQLDLLMKASRDLKGLYMVNNNGVVNVDNIDFRQMQFIPVDSTGGPRGADIAPLPAAGDLNLAQFIFNERQAAIYKTLFAEPLGRIDLPVKSATEIAYRQQELAKRTGPAFGKIQFELLIPLVNRLLHILDELDLISVPREFKVDGRIVGIQYMSPLAQAQDLDDFQAAVQLYQLIGGLFGPQMAMMMTKPDKFVAYASEKLHVPSDLVPTEAEFEQAKQLLSQQAGQQAAAQQQAASAPPPEQAMPPVGVAA